MPPNSGVRVNPSDGAGLVKSTVGVAVRGSRVGIGPWVGVDNSTPVGRLIKVGWEAWVGVGASVGGMIWVGVVRCSNNGRAARLTVPAQYMTLAPTIMMTRQP